MYAKHAVMPHSAELDAVNEGGWENMHHRETQGQRQPFPLASFICCQHCPLGEQLPGDADGQPER